MQRFDYDRAVFLLECSQVFQIARNHRRRHEPRIVEDEHLFRRVHHFTRVVDDQSGAFQPVQQKCRADISQMKRRVLPHQHDIDVACQIDPPALARGEVVAFHWLYSNRRSMRGDLAGRRAVALPCERFDVVVPDLMPAGLRSQHQREAAVSGDIDAFQRVHLDSDAKAHADLLRLPGIGDVARECSRRKEDDVNADILPIFRIPVRHGFGSCGNAGKTSFVDCVIKLIFLAAPFHLDKGDQLAALGDEIDFTRLGFHPLPENMPTLGAEPEGRPRLAIASALFGDLPFHSDLRSIARA